MNRNITLWLVRHGETIENKSNICQGQTHGTLSEKGVMQAKRLAGSLKHYVFDQIWSSDLGRALRTTEIICSAQSAFVPVQQDIRLRERFFGSFQGHTFPENRKGFHYPPDVESIEEMGVRLSSFLNELYEKGNQKVVLLVTHGVALRVILSLLLYGNTSQTDQLPLLENASATRVCIENGRVVEIDYTPCEK